MSIMGLNNTSKFYRQVQGNDDAYGGAVRTETLLYKGIKTRTGPRFHTEDYRIVGIESPRDLQSVVYPGNLDLREQDIQVPDNGPYAGEKLLIVAILKDSIRPNNRNAHMELYLSRIEESRDRY